jgi:DnaJ-domain-containing protein 1
VTAGGEQQFIAKSAIRAVRSMEIPKADQLNLEARQAGFADLDAHAVLGVGREAPPEEIRQAYHRMARLYHPDRIASYDLPEEIKDYARAMLVRINLAFEQLRR